MEGLLGSALQAVHAALGAAEGAWRAAQAAIEEGQRQAAAAALATNEHRNPLIASTLSVDAVAVLMTSYLSVKDQCRTQLVSRALAAVVGTDKCVGHTLPHRPILCGSRAGCLSPARALFAICCLYHMYGAC